VLYNHGTDESIVHPLAISSPQLIHEATKQAAVDI